MLLSVEESDPEKPQIHTLSRILQSVVQLQGQVCRAWQPK